MNPKIKDLLGAVGVIGILVASYSGYVYAKSFGPGVYREFSVSGDAKVTAVPDVAQFTFTVITEGKDLGKVQEQNNTKAQKAIDLVKANGVDAKDIETQQYNVSPKYTSYNCGGYMITSSVEPCPAPTIEGYTVTQTVAVKVRKDFSKVGDMLSGVVNQGANQVSTLSFTVDDPDVAKQEAREKAIAKARAKAEAVAKAGGFSLGKLMGIDESGAYPYYEARGMGGSDIAVSAVAPKAMAVPVEAGSDDISVSVTLRYQIK
jgi:uncharacterized protein YggE